MTIYVNKIGDKINDDAVLVGNVAAVSTMENLGTK